MEKIKKIINKFDLLYVFIIFSALLIIPSFGLKLRPYDELWNFTNIYKMTNGFKIYQECNVIITPLFFETGKVLFNIFGANYFGFHIYNILINAFLFTSVYYLFRSVKLNKKKALLYSLVMILVENTVVFWGANYNNLAIAFSIIGVSLFIRNKNYFWQGLIIFLVFMTKQNIGVYYAIGITIARFLKDKNFKTICLETIINGTFAGLLISLYMIYLYFNGNLHDFIDLVFLGISEFAIQNISAQLFNLRPVLFQIVVTICVIIVINNKKIPLCKEDKDHLKVLISISIPFMIIEYPIFNTAHLMLASMFIIITYIVMLEKLMLKDFFTTKKKVVIVSMLFTILFIIVSIWTVLGYIKIPFVKDKNSPYYGAKVEQKTLNSIDIVCDYIRKNDEQGKRTIIVSYKADLYVNTLKQNNNKFDLPFHGNLGKAGEDGLISEVDKLENTYILITKDVLGFQECDKLIKHISNNYEKVGTIDEFDIYKSHDM